MIYKFKDLLKIKYGKNQKKVENPLGKYPIYGTGGLMSYADDYLFDKPSILIGRKGSISKVRYIDEPFWTVDTLFYTEVNTDIVIPKYLYYKLSLIDFNEYNEGTSIPSLRTDTLYEIEIDIPSIEEQKKVISLLNPLDARVKLNNEINNNLEEQLKVLFDLKMSQCNEFDECTLYDEFNVIDNRGKTPPLVNKSEYPIIDVKVLSGNSRVINYNDALKYVSKETYDTFFRSGHPQKYDSLLSTVGSLAEMKIYLENIGTIAQNVVALRPKNNYPLFMYQYLLSIRKTLTSYDIGSVQPSIKVTQFMKEIIKIPKDKNVILEFEQLAKAYTDKMVNIMQENRFLEQLRDTLLPRLMNGEIDLDNIEI